MKLLFVIPEVLKKKCLHTFFLNWWNLLYFGALTYILHHDGSFFNFMIRMFLTIVSRSVASILFSYLCLNLLWHPSLIELSVSLFEKKTCKNVIIYLSIYLFIVFR
jgi:hypothetical protein